jgi:16S rRNA U1498 N3-methylase RsmE
VTKKQTQDPLISPNTLGSDQDDAIIWVVGPEGGLTDRDYRHFPSHIVSSLGNTILRMETAAIVGAYVLLSSS